MTEQAPSPLAEQALARLRAYAKDNGLAPENIRLIAAKEAVHEVQGLVRLVPSFTVENATTFGRLKSKDRKMQPSFQALREEVERLRSAFEGGSSWINSALAEIEKDPTHGWGLDGASITWSGQDSSILAATENCPTCRGTAMSTCLECRGIGTVPCLYCEGHGQEMCPHCAGQGMDPANPQKPCPHCNGTRFTPCRFCHATGKVPCPQCHGKGGLPCPDCRGTGFITQESKVSAGAKIAFSLGATTDIPSGLLRMMSRIGEATLAKGHADISMKKASPDPANGEDPSRISLTAKIPYAEAKFLFGKHEAKIIIFGKMNRLSDVPFFLDKSAAQAREALRMAVQGTGSLDKALTIRLMREALDLVLSGRKNPNDLRRLYPVGLSGGAAQEIMGNIRLALKVMTMKYRGLAGGVALLLSGLIFGVFFFSPLYKTLSQSLNQTLFRLIEIALPLAAMGGAFVCLDGIIRRVLRTKFPKAKIRQSQNIGKIGYSVLGAIVLLYVLFFFLATRIFP